MDALSNDETRELLIGTWVGVAMIVEMLIEQGLVSREDLLLLLSRAQMAAPIGARQRSPGCGFWSNAASPELLGAAGPRRHNGWRRNSSIVRRARLIAL